MSRGRTEAGAGSGVYVYAVLPAGSASVPSGLVGLDGRGEVTVCEHDGLAAVVSAVDLDEFGEEQLRDNLVRPEWLEERARGHQRVLAAFVDAPALLPLRFGAIFHGGEQVRAMLAENAETFARTLERLRGTREWAVKGFVDHEVLMSDLAGPDDATDEPRGEGHAYFARKQREADAQERAHAAVEELAREVHETLATYAAQASLLAVRGDARPLALNAAYLVEREKETAFLRVVERVAQEREARGLRVEVTGPWPPYSFAGGSEDTV